MPIKDRMKNKRAFDADKKYSDDFLVPYAGI